MRNLLIIGLVSVMVLGATGLALAAPWGGLGRGDKMLGTEDCVIADLNLSDEQVSQIQEIHSSAFERLSSIRNALFEKMFELRNMRWQKQPDAKAAEALQAEITTLREQMKQVQQEMLEARNSVLTEEQLEKLSQARASHSERVKRGGLRYNRGSAPGMATTGSL
ncbi:MAG: Spy/CpxP family protein refolding chaperone [Bacillota bacterium]